MTGVHEPATPGLITIVPVAGSTAGGVNSVIGMVKSCVPVSRRSLVSSNWIATEAAGVGSVQYVAMRLSTLEIETVLAT